jgi:hypothetical protein
LNKLPVIEPVSDEQFNSLIDLIVEKEIRVLFLITPIGDFYWNIFDELYDRGLDGTDFVIFSIGIHISYYTFVDDPVLKEKRSSFIHRSFILLQETLIGEIGQNYIKNHMI